MRFGITVSDIGDGVLATSAYLSGNSFVGALFSASFPILINEWSLLTCTIYPDGRVLFYKNNEVISDVSFGVFIELSDVLGGPGSSMFVPYAGHYGTDGCLIFDIAKTKNVGKNTFIPIRN